MGFTALDIAIMTRSVKMVLLFAKHDVDEVEKVRVDELLNMSCEDVKEALTNMADASSPKLDPETFTQDNKKRIEILLSC